MRTGMEILDAEIFDPEDGDAESREDSAGKEPGGMQANGAPARREEGRAADRARTGGAPSVEVFEYPEGPSERLADLQSLAEAFSGTVEAPSAAVPATAGEQKLRAEFDQRVETEVRRAFEAGRAAGVEEGRRSERDVLATARQQIESGRSTEVAHLTSEFARERDQYLHRVEHEVVQLALAVAARILRREAQMDPLLLTGAVRVALGQLSQTTVVRLRVPPGDLRLWAETMAHLPNLSVRPEVVAGEGMRVGECTVETELGSVDLGIRAQLSEIERGFFDRAGAAEPVVVPKPGEAA